MKLFILSIDAMITSDLEKLRKQSSFQPLFDNMVIAENMKVVYPALTYPCHVSIVTGNNPDKHGIYHNEILAPKTNNGDWHWYHEQIKCKTLFDYFIESGYKTSSIFWPVTAGSQVDYLVPEIWSREKDSLEIIKQTSSHNIDHILEKNHEYLDFRSKLKLDIFATNCATEIIQEFNPDVMFLHWSLLDSNRHKYGLQHNQIDTAFEYFNTWFSAILCELEKLQSLEDITFIILGDHGQLPIDKEIALNSLFLEKGLLTIDLNKKVTDFHAYCHSAGVSAQIYLDKKYQSDDKVIIDIFKELQLNGYIENYFSKKEVESWGLSGKFDYVLEASDTFSFISEIREKLINGMEMPDGVCYRGKHGHFPMKGDKPPFCISHRHLENKILDKNYEIIDIAPTIVSVFNITHGEMDGKEIDEIVEAMGRVIKGNIM